eukprot:TRINITY_DN67362_c0_g1_i1.p1 TRINITY_DN67362_c0_g1~~TRINITY_DN67362_c0_g1_i1.p1  ORF type:complete len:133 (-),score=18.21 TRINITY_DN67362_c0_g1_i1:107-505(-)
MGKTSAAFVIGSGLAIFADALNCDVGLSVGDYMRIPCGASQGSMWKTEKECTTGNCCWDDKEPENKCFYPADGPDHFCANTPGHNTYCASGCCKSAGPECCCLNAGLCHICAQGTCKAPGLNATNAGTSMLV